MGSHLGLGWVWINFRLAVTASQAGPYNPRWFCRAPGRSSPRAITRHAQPRNQWLGERPRCGNDQEPP